MTDDQYNADNIKIIEGSPYEMIRNNPAMFVGSTEFFGLINYFVNIYNLCLQPNVSFIDFQETEAGFVIKADSYLNIYEANDLIYPFEEQDAKKIFKWFAAAIITMLSEYIDIKIISNGYLWHLLFKKGKRLTWSKIQSNESPHIILNFQPDAEIFAITKISNANIHHYLNRLRHLYPNVCFSTTIAGQTTTYQSRGIIELFENISQPYQCLHPPILIQTKQDTLHLTLVFAFHSWHQHHLLSFMNKGRVIDGGFHEKGLIKAIKKIIKLLKLQSSMGVIAVMALDYPQARYLGCLHTKIGNPELETMVYDIVIAGIKKWAEAFPEEVSLLQKADGFIFF